ncbi:MAG: sulfatase-like hydrolase/transferase [Actinomycetota bacterium]|nr:sulfatase-like hydrolase/transferase [Actinomycetota bacterium]
MSGAVFAAVLGVLVALGAGISGGKAAAESIPQRPNIIVIQTDDQTVQQLRVMKNTRRLLGKQGATFQRQYVNWPICCPSRATLLTGQYAHNHGVLGNLTPAGGYPAFDNKNTTAVWLQARGYTTAHVGKFMNHYGATVKKTGNAVPPGWDEWYTAPGSPVYNYPLNQNGRWVKYGAKRRDFKQDVLTRRAVQLIGEHIGAGGPLYLQLDYTAPHAGGPDPMPQPPFHRCLRSAKPAPRHAKAFRGAPLPRPPSFNEADVSDKPKLIRRLPRMSSSTIKDLTRRHRCRLASLLAVDEGVVKVARALRAEGVLERTFVIFTSDNGLFTGEHRLVQGKSLVYEPASRVPLLMRGPGVPAGVNVRDLTINADIAATVAEISGARPTHELDGRSLLPVVQHPWVETGRELLIETDRYDAIRTDRYLWVEHNTGERELYDLHKDPHQLESRHRPNDNPPYPMVGRRLEERLAALRNCVGETCRIPVALAVEVSGEQDPEGCSQPPVTVGLAGDDVREVDELVVFVDGQRAGSDTDNPFEVRLEREQLGSGAVTLRVRASLIDGRRVGWERKLQVCP